MKYARTLRPRSSRLTPFFCLILLTLIIVLSGCGDDDKNDPITPDETIEQTMLLPGATQWLASELTLADGDELAVASSGTIVYDLDGNTCGPQGTLWTDTADRLDPLWEQSHAGIIGKIGADGTPFFIGEELNFTSAAAGTLYLGINDYWYQQNSGEFLVEMTLTPEN